MNVPDLTTTAADCYAAWAFVAGLSGQLADGRALDMEQQRELVDIAEQALRLLVAVREAQGSAGAEVPMVTLSPEQLADAPKWLRELIERGRA